MKVKAIDMFNLLFNNTNLRNTEEATSLTFLFVIINKGWHS